MLHGKILIRLHLLQAGDRSFKLKLQMPAPVKLQQGLGGGQYQLHIVIVKLVHEVDKSARLVVLVGDKLRHTGDQHSVEDTGKFDVIILGTRTVT